MPRPDALMLSGSKKSGDSAAQRIDSMVRLVEPILQVDRSQGERAYLRQQDHGQVFVTRDPTDTILYPTSHPREGQPRYNWVEADFDRDIQLGYLRDRPAKDDTSTDAVVVAGVLDGTGGLGGIG